MPPAVKVSEVGGEVEGSSSKKALEPSDDSPGGPVPGEPRLKFLYLSLSTDFTRKWPP